MTSQRPAAAIPLQQQERIPGRTAPMNPPPDHGEQSSRGSGRLEGKVASDAPSASSLRAKAQTSPLLTTTKVMTRRKPLAGWKTPGGARSRCWNSDPLPIENNGIDECAVIL
jgi:hypothetical protein